MIIASRHLITSRYQFASCGYNLPPARFIPPARLLSLVRSNLITSFYQTDGPFSVVNIRNGRAEARTGAIRRNATLEMLIHGNVSGAREG